MLYWSCSKCANNLALKSYKNIQAIDNDFVLIYSCNICNKKNYTKAKNAIEIHGAKVLKVFDKDVYTKEQIVSELSRSKLNFADDI